MMIFSKNIDLFITELETNEYSANTIAKYQTDLNKLVNFLPDREPTKKDIIAFKEELSKCYKPRSVNSILAACNRYFNFIERPDLKVKQLKIQQDAFCAEDKELTKQEYKQLVNTARKSGKEIIALVIQTICSTGIRVSELKFITVEAIKNGKADIKMKGKHRTVLIPSKMRKMLLIYAKRSQIIRGSIFVTSRGNPFDRSNIWKKMKEVSEAAQIPSGKVFPHNLRHLFAREFYRIQMDIAKLADILGHSNINTTRIYIVSTGEEHKRVLEKMQLIS